MRCHCVATGSAYAQETTPGPGKAEVTIIPEDGRSLRRRDRSQASGTTTLAARSPTTSRGWCGVEGEVGGSLGVKQDLDMLVGTVNEKTPNMLSYIGNVIVNLPGHSVDCPRNRRRRRAHAVPARASGSLQQRYVPDRERGWRREVGPRRTAAGGIRGDYRFQVTQSKTNAPEFFRAGHQIRPPSLRRGSHQRRQVIESLIPNP